MAHVCRFSADRETQLPAPGTVSKISKLGFETEEAQLWLILNLLKGTMQNVKTSTSDQNEMKDLMNKKVNK